MSSLLHKRIKERRNSISNRELLVAAGTGDVSRIDSLLREGAKVDFVDRDGNSALHYAVESGSLNSVRKLLVKGANVSVENNANKTPYDIAIRLDSEKQFLDASMKDYRLLTEELEKKIFHDSRQLLETAAGNFKIVEIPENCSEQHESFLEREINNTESKMKFCLDYLIKLNKTKGSTTNLSFEQANVFLYFAEAFALQGSGSKNNLRTKVKAGDKSINLRTKVKEYFCPLCYSNDDLKQLENARAILVKKPEKKIRLEDVRKFIIGDISEFFHNLEKYVKNVCDRLDGYSYAKQLHCFLYKLETSNSASYGVDGTKDLIKKEFEKLREVAESEIHVSCERKFSPFVNRLETGEKIDNLKKDIESFLKGEIKKLTETKEEEKKTTEEANNSDVKLQNFLKQLDTKDDNIGEHASDIKTFLRGEFESLIKAAYGKQEELPAKLFNFVTNFYPAFEKVTGKDFLEVSRLRNAVMHALHKYGYAEFGNEIRSLKGELFKYYFAQEIHDVIEFITPIQSPEIVSTNFKDKLSHFKEEFDTTDCVISQAQARDYFGFEDKYSQPLFPEADMDPAVLVDQYLKFMIIIDCERSEDFLIDTDKEDVLNEKQDDFLSDNDNDEIRNLKQDDILDDAERREVFENFSRLKRLKNFCKEGYDEEKQRLKEVLVAKHGVNGSQFDKVCETYIEKGCEFADNDKGKVKEIAETVNNLKKIKDHYELSSEVIISLHSQFVEKQGMFDSRQRRNILSDVDEGIQEKIKNELPVDNTINITIGDEVFVLRTGKIISNMLKIFYNAFHEYQAEFNIEEIFNDDSFLEYLMRKENCTGKDKSSHRTFTIIKKLLNTEFTTPFIVRLLLEEKTGEVMETEDLVKLITILLKKKEGLYMKHLNYFLKESENPKLYETVCQILLEQDVNIESGHLIFKEPQHAKAILNVLYQRIVSSNCNEKRRIVELTKGILIIMWRASYNLQRKGCYDVALNVLDEMLTTHEDLIRDNLMESNDLTFLRAKYLKAEIKIAEGRTKKDKVEKTKLHEEALIISCSIQDALRYKKGPGDTRQSRDLKGTEVPVFLLSSSTATYSERLLGNYEAADERVEILYQDIIKFALNLPNESSLCDNFLTDERYYDVIGSKKYQSFLNFSDESKKYLDILNIRIEAAYSKISNGRHETFKKRYSSGLKHFEDALGILKEIYYRQKHQGLEKKFMIRILNQISRVNNFIAECWTRKTYEVKEDELLGHQKALQYYYLAMQQRNIVYRLEEEILWPNHPFLAASRKQIIGYMRNAAHTYKRIGIAFKTLFGQKKGYNYFRKALGMYQKVYDTLRKYTQGRHCSLISQTVHDIVYTLLRLQNFEKAKAKLEDLLKTEVEFYGESHPKPEKTKALIERVDSTADNRSSSPACRKGK